MLSEFQLKKLSEPLQAALMCRHAANPESVTTSDLVMTAGFDQPGLEPAEAPTLMGRATSSTYISNWFLINGNGEICMVCPKRTEGPASEDPFYLLLQLMCLDDPSLCVFKGSYRTGYGPHADKFLIGSIDDAGVVDGREELREIVSQDGWGVEVMNFLSSQVTGLPIEEFLGCPASTRHTLKALSFAQTLLTFKWAIENAKCDPSAAAEHMRRTFTNLAGGLTEACADYMEGLIFPEEPEPAGV